jgi:hypothetical protein
VDLWRLFLGLFRHKSIVAKVQAAEWTPATPAEQGPIEVTAQQASTDEEKRYPLPQPERRKTGDLVRKWRQENMSGPLPKTSVSGDLPHVVSAPAPEPSIDELPTRPPVPVPVEKNGEPLVASSWPAREQVRESIFADVPGVETIVLEDDDPTEISETTRQRRFEQAIRAICE